MTDAPLGIANDRANWKLQALDGTSTTLLWRTDGPGQHIAVCQLNGWCIGLFQAVRVGIERVMVCSVCGTQHPDPDQYLEADAAPSRDESRCQECDAPNEPSTLTKAAEATLAVPVQLYLDVDPACVADHVEQLQRSAESLREPER